MEIVTDPNGIDMVALTYEEEQSLAQIVMDCMALRWVRGDFQELLDMIYQMKCRRGYWPRLEDMECLLGYLERYNLPEPEFEPNQKNIKHDLDWKSFSSYEEINEETRRTIIRAWREIWEKHDSLKAIADGYKCFPGDETREERHNKDVLLEQQQTLEKMFWEEVSRIEDEFECSRMDAIVMVSDYIPRKGISTD